MFSYRYVIAISLGAVWGSLLRWSIGIITYHYSSNPFIGTLCVNLLGCFLMGIIYIALAYSDYYEIFKSLIIIGFLGSLTTFSAFSLVVNLIRDFKISLAMIVILLNLLGSLAMTFFRYCAGIIFQEKLREG